MLKTWAPELSEDFLERSDHAGGNERPMLGKRARENIEGERKLALARLEENDVVCARSGDRREHGVAEVAVGIDQSHAAAGGDIGADEPMEQGRFAHARLSLDEEMTPAVIGEDATRSLSSTKDGNAEDGHVGRAGWVGQLHRRLRLPAFDPGHRRGLDGCGRRMPEGGQFLAGEEKSSPTPCLSHSHSAHLEARKSREAELPERGGDMAEPALTLRLPAGRRGDPKDDLRLEEQATDFLTRRLHVRLPFMQATAGGVESGGRYAIARSGELPEEVSEAPKPRPGRQLPGEIPAGERRVRLEQRAGQSVQTALQPRDPVWGRWANEDIDRRREGGVAVVGEAREEGCKGICGLPVQSVLELAVAFAGEELGREPDVGRPSDRARRRRQRGYGQ